MFLYWKLKGFILKFMNVRKSKNVRRYQCNQIARQHPANKAASFIRTSEILKLSYIVKHRANPIINIFLQAGADKRFGTSWKGYKLTRGVAHVP